MQANRAQNRKTSLSCHLRPHRLPLEPVEERIRVSPRLLSDRCRVARRAMMMKTSWLVDGKRQNQVRVL